MLVDTLDAIAAGMEAVEKAEKAEQTADSPPLRLAQRLPAMVPYRRVHVAGSTATDHSRGNEVTPARETDPRVRSHARSGLRAPSHRAGVRNLSPRPQGLKIIFVSADGRPMAMRVDACHDGQAASRHPDRRGARCAGARRIVSGDRRWALATVEHHRSACCRPLQNRTSVAVALTHRCLSGVRHLDDRKRPDTRRSGGPWRAVVGGGKLLHVGRAPTLRTAHPPAAVNRYGFSAALM